MLHAYCLFDDFNMKLIRALEAHNIKINLQPSGKPRPSSDEMKKLLKANDIIIIGTSQKINEDMFDSITNPKIIATASVGVDHIRIPEDKKSMVTVLNAPTANAESVAEYIITTALMCRKRIIESCRLYTVGKNNKQLRQKPEDLQGAVLGIIGAGNISQKVMEFANLLNMKILCYTAHPDIHIDLQKKVHIQFVSLKELAKVSDIISVNLPYSPETKNLISPEIVSLFKDTAIFISISRKEVMDISALLRKASACSDFYVCLDIDVFPEIAESYSFSDNVIITPHIAGGTVEARQRMFQEVTDRIINYLQQENS